VYRELQQYTQLSHCGEAQPKKEKVSEHVPGESPTLFGNKRGWQDCPRD
jgi:hypothetical protein